MKFLAPLFLVLSLLTLPARASQEGADKLTNFVVEAQWGVVSGKQDDSGITQLSVRAFGKTHTLSKSQLQELHGLMVNGIQLSSEGGYEGHGGRTLYIALSFGFTTGIESQKFVVVSEENGISVQDLRPPPPPNNSFKPSPLRGLGAGAMIEPSPRPLSGPA